MEPPLSRRTLLSPIARALTALKTEDSSEARLFLQQRLAFFLKLIASLSGGFFAIGLGITAAVSPQHLDHHLSHPATIAHVTSTLAMVVMWLYVASGPRSGRALDAVDAVGTTLLGITYATMTTGKHDGEQAELVPLLAVGWTLVARAALVPSHAARTAVLGVTATAPLLVMTYVTVDNDPVMRTIYAGFWTSTAIITTTVISRIIYGLVRQVRQAMKVGQYTLVESIGEGGMGVVYRADHALLRRPTAIKLLAPEKAGRTDVARFEREVQVTSQLTHPNTVAIYDFGRTPDGVFYYAMEYLEGLTLEHLVKAGGPLPPARAIHLVTQICGALHEAHRSGVVHRDIKPANVIVTTRGCVPDVAKVLDFGLVKIVEQGAADLSGQSTITGTPLYMAPEAIVDPNAIDARADIYAVGATLYYLLTGSTVFTGRTLIEICSKHLHEVPAAPSERTGEPLPAELDALVLRCLAKSPDDRPRTVAEVAERLGAIAVEPWTTAMAQAWWDEHGEDLRRLVRDDRRMSAAVSSGPRTLTIDLARA